MDSRLLELVADLTKQGMELPKTLRFLLNDKGGWARTVRARAIRYSIYGNVSLCARTRDRDNRVG